MGKSQTLEDKLSIFHRAFKHPLGLDYPQPKPYADDQKNLRRSLIQEEFRELMYAISNQDDDDGNPIYREDGKVIKSSCYEPPKLMDLV